MNVERTPSLSELSPSEIEVRPVEKSRKWTTVVTACCVAVVIAGASALVTLAVTGQLSSDDSGVAEEVLADCVENDGTVREVVLGLGAGAVPIGRAVTPEFVITDRGISAIFVLQAYADALGRDDITAAALTSTCETIFQQTLRIWENFQ